jgi:hypothetical protein
MRTYKFVLAALLLGAAGACCAGVPVIQLAPPAGDSVRHVAGAAQQQIVPGALRPAASPAGSAQRRQSAGSFASYASGAFSVLASAAAMPLTTGTHDGVLVAARPLPSFGAVLLLVLGCLMYLGRRRRHGFALRPARTLLERLEHAPAHA